MFHQAVLMWHDALEISVKILTFTKKMHLPQCAISLFHCSIQQANNPRSLIQNSFIHCMKIQKSVSDANSTITIFFILELSFCSNYTLSSTYKLGYAVHFSFAGKRQQTKPLGILNIALSESPQTQLIHQSFIVNKDKDID